MRWLLRRWRDPARTTQVHQPRLSHELQVIRDANVELHAKTSDLQDKLDQEDDDGETDLLPDCTGLRMLRLVEGLLDGQQAPSVGELEGLRTLLLHTQHLWAPHQLPTLPHLEPEVVKSLMTLLTRADVAVAANVPVVNLGELSPAPAHPPVSLQPPDTLARLLATANDWCWDAFRLDQATGGHALSQLALHLFRTSGLVEKFDIPEAKLMRFLLRAEGAYKHHPYHNSTHAADVLHTMHKLMTDGGVFPAYADQVDCLSCYIAAIIHDIDHSGFTNDFLVNTTHSLAIMHNDQSPHENHHLFLSWTLLTEERYNFLENVSAAVKQRVRQSVIDMVLATDLKSHLPVITQFCFKFKAAKTSASGDTSSQSRSRSSSQRSDRGASPPCVSTDAEERMLVLQMVIKLADLGHLAAHRAVHCRWVALLEEEYFRQGDVERARSMQVSPLMDRAKGKGVTHSQVGFFELVALPMVRAFTRVLPHSLPMRTAIENNHAYWLQEELKRSSCAPA